MALPDIQALLAAFRAALGAATTPEALDEVRREYTGKNSALKAALKGLRDVPADDRPRVAAEINGAQDAMTRELDEVAALAAAMALAAQLDAEWQDLSLPGLAPALGARHPLTDVEERCASVLRQLGFALVEGPEVEDPYYNFDALNIPKHHPARDMQDTFWVTGGKLLRSHTTTVQARVLEANLARSSQGLPPELPLRVFSKGRVYRNEAVDATHLAMFHQFEGIWVDRGFTFANLKGVLAFIVRALWGDQKIRFKPKFYPYTEPSVGVDLWSEANQNWVTIVGAGMIHPKVLREFGYNPDEVNGIAFGFGTTRMAAEWAGSNKLRPLYDQDLRTLSSIHRGSR